MPAQKNVAIPAPSTKALPIKLGSAVDLLYTRRQARIEKEREVAGIIDALKQAEIEAEEHITNLLKSQGLTSARGELASATIVPKKMPIVEDWAKFYAYMFKAKDGALLQKRLATTHVKEILEDKKSIPGVKISEFDDLSLTKAAKSGS